MSGAPKLDDNFPNEEQLDKSKNAAMILEDFSAIAEASRPKPQTYGGETLQTDTVMSRFLTLLMSSFIGFAGGVLLTTLLLMGDLDLRVKTIKDWLSFLH